MAKNTATIHGMFVPGGNMSMPWDASEVNTFALYRKRRYGTEWRFLSRWPCSQHVGDSHYEDGYMLVFERNLK
jgi:hypothetical protein